MGILHFRIFLNKLFGKKRAFEGLYLKKDWNWERSYPVIHIEFGKAKTETLKLFQRYEIGLTEELFRKETYRISRKTL
ncbi:MAG: hypothetical protein NZ530_01975 [Thermodesulfobacteriaceae bacterium]|nr:hypothetical protein [Thermodesulfobacteriaceae bacterium]MCX8042326.1 hypothetical protein [Thermodesulfobacteriaceae bacterium]MDW8135779.1 hypothetical protein [Thermodesulfobacterium sp.]